MFGLYIVCATPANSAVLLSDLIKPGTSLEAGELIFSNFIILEQTSFNGGSHPDPAKISVSAFKDADYDGLIFTFNAGGLSTNGPEAYTSLTISYEINSLERKNYITSNRLIISGMSKADSTADLVSDFLDGQFSQIQNYAYIDNALGDLKANDLELTEAKSSWIVRTSLVLHSHEVNSSVNVTSFSTLFTTYEQTSP